MEPVPLWSALRHVCLCLCNLQKEHALLTLQCYFWSKDHVQAPGTLHLPRGNISGVCPGPLLVGLAPLRIQPDRPLARFGSIWADLGSIWAVARLSLGKNHVQAPGTLRLPRGNPSGVCPGPLMVGLARLRAQPDRPRSRFGSIWADLGPIWAVSRLFLEQKSRPSPRNVTFAPRKSLGNLPRTSPGGACTAPGTPGPASVSIWSIGADLGPIWAVSRLFLERKSRPIPRNFTFAPSKSLGDVPRTSPRGFNPGPGPGRPSAGPIWANLGCFEPFLGWFRGKSQPWTFQHGQHGEVAPAKAVNILPEPSEGCPYPPTPLNDFTEEATNQN